MAGNIKVVKDTRRYSAFSNYSPNTIAATSSTIQWPGGKGVMKVDGTFIGGAATAVVKLKILSPDGASYLDVGPDVTFSAEGVGAFLAGEDTLRVDISTATVSGLYCTIDLLPD